MKELTNSSRRQEEVFQKIRRGQKVENIKVKWCEEQEKSRRREKKPKWAKSRNIWKLDNKYSRTGGKKKR